MREEDKILYGIEETYFKLQWQVEQAYLSFLSCLPALYNMTQV